MAKFVDFKLTEEEKEANKKASRLAAQEKAKKRAEMETPEEKAERLETTKQGRVCRCCKKPKHNSSFKKNPLSDTMEPYLEVCNVCISEYYKKVKDIYGGNLGVATWATTMWLGLPMIFAAWNQAQVLLERAKSKPGSNPEMISLYLEELYIYGRTIPIVGLWESDMEMSDFVEVEKGDFEQLQKADVLIQGGVKVQKKFWGDFDAADLLYLSQTYKEYTQDLGEMDVNLKNRYKDLCRAELRLSKASQSLDSVEVSRAQDNVTKLLKLLKLDDFESNKVSAEEKLIERQIWLMENTEPAEWEDLEKYKDVSGFGETWEHIGRCVQNLIAGTRNYPDVPKWVEKTLSKVKGES